jgi:hypothetical protein
MHSIHTVSLIRSESWFRHTASYGTCRGFVPLETSVTRGLVPFSDGAEARVPFAASESGLFASSLRLLALPIERVTPRRLTLGPQAGRVRRKAAPPTCSTRRPCPRLG